MINDKQRVAIVILSYNNIDDTIECIKSINKAHFSKCMDIFLIDNSSTDDYLNQILSKVDVFYSTRSDNKGYSHGNNIGIKEALQLGYPYIMILNNDTIVDEDFIDPLIKMLNSDSKAGIVAPLIKRYVDKKIWSSGGQFRRWLYNYEMKNNAINSDNKCSFITGCCFIAKSELFNEVGLLKEEYFMYNEDAEFCHRIDRIGKNNYVLKDSIILHKVSISSEVGSPFQLYYLYRNRIAFAYQEFLGLEKEYAVFINCLQALYRIFRLLLNGDKLGARAVRYAIGDARNINGRGRY